MNKSDVDVTFTVEPSDNLAGRITGITLSDPIYNDTVYVSENLVMTILNTYT